MSKKSLILVILQFSSFIFFALDKNLFAKNFWLYLQIIGLTIGFWGILTMKFGNFNIQPEVKQQAKLVTTGLYKIIRNPMYTGILLFLGISVLKDFTPLRLVVYLILTLVLILKIFMEEQFLTNHFGKQYTAYKKKTFRLVPFIF